MESSIKEILFKWQKVISTIIKCSRRHTCINNGSVMIYNFSTAYSAYRIVFTPEFAKLTKIGDESSAKFSDSEDACVCIIYICDPCNEIINYENAAKFLRWATYAC